MSLIKLVSDAELGHACVGMRGCACHNYVSIKVFNPVSVPDSRKRHASHLDLFDVVHRSHDCVDRLTWYTALSQVGSQTRSTRSEVTERIGTLPKFCTPTGGCLQLCVDRIRRTCACCQPDAADSAQLLGFVY